MAKKWQFNLLLFEGGAAGASAAPAAGESGREAAAISPGTLEDGTQVDNRLAARLEKQARKRKARGEDVRMTGAPAAAGTSAAGAEVQRQQAQQKPQEEQPSLEERWKELRKGEFRELYSRDVQAAIQDRFKNQQNLSDELSKLQPMLKALMQKNGVDNVDDLSKVILDDDSLYEEAAEQAGMTVEGYKLFKTLQEEHDARKAQDEREAQQRFYNQHFAELARQAEELKKTFPDLDLSREMENTTFRRLTMPNSGLSLESAYYAVHHKELAPQAMAYGIDRARSQISQSLQANSMRPNEGAMQGGQTIDVSIDPRTMTRKQREALKQRARRGETVVF